MQEGDILRFTLPENEDTKREVREFALERLEKSVKFEGVGTVISVTDEEIICRVDKVELEPKSDGEAIAVDDDMGNDSEVPTGAINLTIISG